MFKGKEDDVFKGHQPNLFCNHVRRDGLYVDKLRSGPDVPCVAVLLVPGAAQTLAGQDLAVLRQASVSLLGFILLQLGMELFYSALLRKVLSPASIPCRPTTRNSGKLRGGTGNMLPNSISSEAVTLIMTWSPT